MSDSATERARLRRYPELPVWVVEDHQEVSGQAAGRVVAGLSGAPALESPGPEQNLTARQLT